MSTRFTARPRLEALEDRVVPAGGIFQWEGDVNTLVTEGGNWKKIAGDATYTTPHTKDDRAILTGSVPRAPHIQAGTTWTVGSMIFKNDYQVLDAGSPDEFYMQDAFEGGETTVTTHELFVESDFAGTWSLGFRAALSLDGSAKYTGPGDPASDHAFEIHGSDDAPSFNITGKRLSLIEVIDGADLYFENGEVQLTGILLGVAGDASVQSMIYLNGDQTQMNGGAVLKVTGVDIGVGEGGTFRIDEGAKIVDTGEGDPSLGWFGSLIVESQDPDAPAFLTVSDLNDVGAGEAVIEMNVHVKGAGAHLRIKQLADLEIQGAPVLGGQTYSLIIDDLAHLEMGHYPAGGPSLNYGTRLHVTDSATYGGPAGGNIKIDNADIVGYEGDYEISANRIDVFRSVWDLFKDANKWDYMGIASIDVFDQLYLEDTLLQIDVDLETGNTGLFSIGGLGSKAVFAGANMEVWFYGWGVPMGMGGSGYWMIAETLTGDVQFVQGKEGLADLNPQVFLEDEGTPDYWVMSYDGDMGGM
jgi:hypothetical protein